MTLFLAVVAWLELGIMCPRFFL